VTQPPPFHRPDGWLRAALATLGFGLLVAGGIADQGSVLPLLVIGIAAVAIGFFYLLFPQGTISPSALRQGLRFMPAFLS